MASGFGAARQVRRADAGRLFARRIAPRRALPVTQARRAALVRTGPVGGAAGRRACRASGRDKSCEFSLVCGRTEGGSVRGVRASARADGMRNGAWGARRSQASTLPPRRVRGRRAARVAARGRCRCLCADPPRRKRSSRKATASPGIPEPSIAGNFPRDFGDPGGVRSALAGRASLMPSTTSARCSAIRSAASCRARAMTAVWRWRSPSICRRPSAGRG